MARRWRRASLVTAAGLLILCAALLLGRFWLAEQVISRVLDAQGLGASQFTVTRLDLEGLTVTNVVVGEHLTADAVTVGRRGWNLSDWQVEADSPVVRARYDGDRLTLGERVIYPADTAASTDGQTDLPKIRLLNPRLELLTPDGPAEVRLDGSVATAGRDGLVQIDGAIRIASPHVSASGTLQTTATIAGSARLDVMLEELTVPGPEGALQLSGVRLTGDLQPGFLDLDVDAELPEQSARLSVSVAAAAPFDRPVIDARGYVDVSRVNRLLNVSSEAPQDQAGAPAARAGAFRMGWRADGVLDIAALLDGGNPGEAFQGEVAIQSSGEGLDLHGSIENLSFAVDGTGRLAGGELVADLTESSLSAVKLVSVPGGGLPFALDGHLGGLKVKLGAGSQLMLSMTDAGLRPDRLSLAGLEVTAEAAKTQGREVQDLRLSGSLQIDHEKTNFNGVLEATSNGWSFQGARAARTRVLLPIEVLGSTTTTQAVILRGWLTARNLRHDGGVFATRPVEAFLALRTHTGPCTLAGCSTALEKLSARLTMTQAGVSLPDAGRIEAHTLSGTLVTEALAKPGDRDLTVDLSIGKVESLRFGRADSLHARGTITQGSGQLDLQVGVERMETVVVSGMNSPDIRFAGHVGGSLQRPVLKGQGTMRETDLPPFALEADTEAVSGRIKGVTAAGLAALPAAREWLPEGFAGAQGEISLNLHHALATGRTSLEAVVTDLGAITDVAVFRGLNGTVRTVSLAPFVTAGPQTLTVALIDAGTELTGLTVTLEADENDGVPAVQVRELAGRLFGGAFRFDPVVIDGSGRPPEMVLHLDRLSMQQMTGLLGFADFSLGGTVSGTVPFAIDDANRVAIRDARLTADGPDVLRLKLDSIGAALEAQMGKQADLLLKALENFQYSVLDARVSKAFGENEQATVRLEGRNPDHLDGQPFIFNISLDSNVVRLADTILALYRATLGEVQSLASKAREIR